MVGYLVVEYLVAGYLVVGYLVVGKLIVGHLTDQTSGCLKSPRFNLILGGVMKSSGSGR